ncbi:MAG: hypothetical protein GY765_39890 [bacterium]|nr:hypothetical protein [bacterium]
MGRKLLFATIIIMLLNVTLATAQTVAQLGFIVKEAMPGVENIAIIVNKLEQAKVEKEAQTATLITKRKFHVYGVVSVGEISKAIYAVQKIKNLAVIAMANKSFLNERSVKYAAQKFGLKGIPIISTRENDTSHGALMVIFKKGENLEKHINKKIAGILKIKFSVEFLSEAVVDVE